MAGHTTEVLSVRLDAGILKMFRSLTSRWHVSDSSLIERLIVAGALTEKLVDPSDPSARLVRLLELVGQKIESLGTSITEDLTRTIAEWIPTDPEAHGAYQGALIPVGVTADRRKQFVNQRLGRFVKEKSGRVSGEEVTLPRDAGLIIRGYTRLYSA